MEVKSGVIPVAGSLWIATVNCSKLKCVNKGKGKGKVHPRTGHEGPEGEWRYSYTLSLTSALDGVGGQRHAPAALPPVKTRYPLYRRLGGPQGRSEQLRKILPPTGIRSRDRPARSESLYRLSAHGPPCTVGTGSTSCE